MCELVIAVQIHTSKEANYCALQSRISFSMHKNKQPASVFLAVAVRNRIRFNLPEIGLPVGVILSPSEL